jgi:hypothetical protein
LLAFRPLSVNVRRTERALEVTGDECRRCPSYPETGQTRENGGRKMLEVVLEVSLSAQTSSHSCDNLAEWRR